MGTPVKQNENKKANRQLNPLKKNSPRGRAEAMASPAMLAELGWVRQRKQIT
jgi:hypothetical protein